MCCGHSFISYGQSFVNIIGYFLPYDLTYIYFMSKGFFLFYENTLRYSESISTISIFPYIFQTLWNWLTLPEKYLEKNITLRIFLFFIFIFCFFNFLHQLWLTKSLFFSLFSVDGHAWCSIYPLWYVCTWNLLLFLLVLFNLERPERNENKKE